MTTLGQLIAHTRHALSGFGNAQDAVSALSAPLDATSTTVSVDDARAVGGSPIAARGTAEVDFEVLRVKSIDPVDGTITLFPFGRGYNGTTAVAHATGTEIRFNPAWPASTVAQHINGVLTEIYPSVYAVKAHETVFPSDRGAIDLPGDAVSVLAVYVEDEQRADQWVREDRWDFKKDSSTIGKGLRVGGHRRPGLALRVMYKARPVRFDLSGALTQDFAAVTGLTERCADLIQIGVAARMAPFIDVSKLPHLGVAPRDSEGSAPGVGATQARLLYSLFQQRIDQEAAVLAQEHPIRLHRTGVSI
jgi:hypothetical protein